MALGVASMVRYRIKALAAKQGMPLTVLAREAKVDQSRLYNISNNKADNVNVKTLEAIARVLGVRIGDLIDDDDPDSELPERAAS